MAFFSTAGIGYLFGRVTRAAAPKPTQIQNSRTLHSFECRSFSAERRARERMQVMRQQRQISKKSNVNVNVNVFAGAEIRNRIGGHSIRSLHEQPPASTQTPEQEQTELAELLKDEKWVAVYRFPGIIVCSFIAKAKFLQTVASAVAIPYVTYLYAAGQQPFEFLATALSAALLAPIALIAFTRSFNRLVGVIAMNEENEYVRLGYLSFFGTRKNAFLPVQDVLPLTETCDVKNMDKIVQLRRLSTNEWFYISTRNINIVDQSRAKLLFGDISGFSQAIVKPKPKSE